MTRPTTIVRALLCVAALGVACSTARAPSDPSARFFSVHTAMQSSGLTQLGSVSRGRLAQSQSLKLPIQAHGECLTVIALGGGEVRDIALALVDQQGKEVGRDEMFGPDASLRYCPDKPGKHELVMFMAQGAGTYALSIWKGGQPAKDVDAAAQGAAMQSGPGTCEAPTVLIPGQTYVGDTEEGRALEEGSCGNSGSRELVYRLDVPTRQRVTIEVRAQFDSVLYVRRSDCTDSDSEVDCNDDAPGGGRRSRIDEVLDPGAYFVFVDGYGEEEGRFRLTVRTHPAPSARGLCGSADLLALSGTRRGTFTDSFDSVRASCGNDARGPDQIYRLEVPTQTRVRIRHRAGGFHPVVHVRSECADEESEVGCSNEGLDSNEASFTGLMAPGTYWVIADSVAESTVGTFELTTEAWDEAGGTDRGDSCGDAVSLAVSAGQVEGDTFPARDDVATSCGSAGAADVVYRLDLQAKAHVFARIMADEGQHTLALQATCGRADTDLACGRLIDRILSPGTYWLVVDSANRNKFGRFRLGYRIRSAKPTENACRAAAVLPPKRTVSASTVGLKSRFSPSCAGAVDAHDAPDRVYRFTIRQKSSVRFKVSPTYPAVIAIRSKCLDRSSEVLCRHLSASPDRTVAATLEPGTYYVIIDGQPPKQDGEFTLNMEVSPEAADKK